MPLYILRFYLFRFWTRKIVGESRRLASASLDSQGSEGYPLPSQVELPICLCS
jgi:hypothetical protein